MIEQNTEKSREELAAEEAVRKAQEKLKNARKKENAKTRKAHDHHKYMMGGIVAKNFRDCYQFEEDELNFILAAAIETRECQNAIAEIRRQCAEKTEEGDGSNDEGMDEADSASVGYDDDENEGRANGAE